MSDATQAFLPVTPDFVREERYIVIKRKHLSKGQEATLRRGLAVNHIETVECVVVEADWPEYEPVWQMIEARMTGQAHSLPGDAVRSAILWQLGVCANNYEREGKEVEAYITRWHMGWIEHATFDAALPSALSGDAGEPVAYLHTLHMEGGQTYDRLTMFNGLDPDDSRVTAFGLPGRDYSEEYSVSTTPLYALLATEAE